MMSVQSIKHAGFAGHSARSTADDVVNAQTICLIAKNILLVETIVLAGLGTAALFSVVVLPTASILFLLAGGYAGSALLTHLTYWKYRAVAGAYYGIIPRLPVQASKGQPVCTGVACHHTVDSFQWKKTLIENARQSIVLSGNYCGGKSFDQILEIIERRLKEVPDLKIVILSSPLFITNDNQATLDRLQSDYPDNFQIISCSEIVHVNPGLKKTSNHTKALVIDGGKYFILGGSGIEDKYAFHDGLEKSQKAGPNYGLLGRLLPRGFRDMDFVFGSKNLCVGNEVYFQLLRLAFRWEGLNYIVKEDVASQTPEGFFGVDTVARSLLFGTFPQVDNTISEFECVASEPMPMRIFCTGPEGVHNPFEKAIVDRLNKAVKRVFIDHMYYHPSKKVQDAMVRVANKGIKIVLITNGNGKGSPGSHKLFGDRNRYHYLELLHRIKPCFRKNVSVYEFKIKKTTLHKKVLVVDDYVIGGSGNLGYKSLETMSDHEMNFMVQNQQFADDVVKILKVDRRRQVHAKKIRGYPGFSLRQTWAAFRHRILAPLIG